MPPGFAGGHWTKAESSGADSETIAQYKKEAEVAAQWSSGGTSRLVFTAVTSAISGNMSGSAAQAGALGASASVVLNNFPVN